MDTQGANGLSGSTHFAAVLDELKDAAVPQRPDMSPRDFLVQLLSIGAHIEHALMVEYLYAAYTLRPHGAVSVETAERWRAAILDVAREEMGHLLTVQNILTLLGAPVDFGRDTSLWAESVFPFPFNLEPFSRKLLVRFTFAEMPADTELSAVEAKAVIKRKARVREKTFRSIVDPKTSAAGARAAQFSGPKLVERLKSDIALDPVLAKGHRVGPTYAAIIRLLSNVEAIPESCFDETSYERQASFDEWGRNYRPPPYQLTPDGDKVGRQAPDDSAAERPAFVQVARVATRKDAIDALRRLSEQGESPHLGDGHLGEPSHYERFLEIYGEILHLESKHGPLSDSPIVVNPTTRSDWRKAPDPDGSAAKPGENPGYTYIHLGRAHLLAQVFNQRYRLLLHYLAHTFRPLRPSRADRPQLRAMLMHRAFAEMYNLKTLASLLVELPASEQPDEKRLAGPPFELPPSLDLPARDSDVWRELRGLLNASRATTHAFLTPEQYPAFNYTKAAIEGSPAQAFVSTLRQIDGATLQWVEGALAGVAGREGD